MLNAVPQEPAAWDGLAAQHAIPHSCDEEREVRGATPASSTSINITARKIRAIGVRAGLSGRDTKSKVAPFSRMACGLVYNGRILSQERMRKQDNDAGWVSG